jgi:hypothetical protein
MSQSVETKVEDLIGEIPDNNATAIDQWATDIAREVINVLPSEMLWQVSTTLQDSNTGTGAAGTISLTEGVITGVTLTQGGSNYTSDPTVTINSANGSGGKIRAFSNGSAVIALDVESGGTGYANSDTISIADSDGVAVSTAKFLYAHRQGYKAIEINSADKARATDSDSIYHATTNNPVFWRESGKVYVEPVGGSVVVVNYPDIKHDDTDVTGVPDDVKHLVIMGTAVKGRLYQLDNLRRTLDDIEAPSYAEESLSLVPIPSIVDLSTSENAPTLVLEPISLSDLAITTTLPITPNNPDFTNILVSTTEATPPTYAMPTQAISFSNAVTQIETNEDVELANAELDKIGTQITELKTSMDNQMNKFNEEMTKYQAEIQMATQEAQMKQGKEFQSYSGEISKYQAELNRYQQEVNKEVTEYATNTLQKDLQIWQKKRNDNMQEYAAKLDLYKTNLSNEKEIYAINKIQKDIGTWQTQQGQKLQKYGADLQQASTKFGSEFQNYQTSINNVFQKHQTMVQELQVLDAQYQRGLQTFVASYREPEKNAKGVN